MDVEKLVEGVARAIYKSLGHEDTDPWAEAVARRDRLGLSEALTLNQTACVHAARSAILATLRGVREPGRDAIIEACHASNEDMEASWKAGVDHLIKTVEG